MKIIRDSSGNCLWIKSHSRLRLLTIFCFEKYTYKENGFFTIITITSLILVGLKFFSEFNNETNYKDSQKKIMPISFQVNK